MSAYNFTFNFPITKRVSAAERDTTSIEALEPDGSSSTRRHIDQYAVLPGHDPLLDRERLRIGAVVRSGAVTIDLRFVALAGREKRQRLSQLAGVLVGQCP